MLLFRFDLKSEQKERSQPVKWIQSLEISVLAFYHWLKTIGSFWKNFSSNKTQENNKLKHFLSHYETDIDTLYFSSWALCCYQVQTFYDHVLKLRWCKPWHLASSPFAEFKSVNVAAEKLEQRKVRKILPKTGFGEEEEAISFSH